MLSRAAARACPASARVLRHSVRAMASSGEPIGRSRAGHSPHLRMAPDADDGMLHNADSQVRAAATGQLCANTPH